MKVLVGICLDILAVLPSMNLESQLDDMSSVIQGDLNGNIHCLASVLNPPKNQRGYITLDESVRKNLDVPNKSVIFWVHHLDKYLHTLL